MRGKFSFAYYDRKVFASSFVSLPDLIGQSREKDMDSPVKPENGSFYFYALRFGQRVLN